ncbi:TPA: hypothetical protein JGR85_004237, partial [Salmonella enterica subsp. enterica serovar Schwarzengrund]|nr:hypothetical protein [Salmonella enterica subsp. enterica serovar Schwarzengrund]
RGKKSAGVSERNQKRSSHYKAHLRVGLIMKPEFILGNQLRQYHETTQASKWGK